MNIIRTAAVELSSIPAIAYKQKLATGGAGIRILRLYRADVAVATIDKRTGLPVAYGTYDAELFPDEAFDEAIDLTAGLPYSARGKIVVTPQPVEAAPEEAPEPEPTPVDAAMVDSAAYRAIVDRYADERGRINYALMNKDFIQYASRSKNVADLVARQASADEVVLYVLSNRAAYIAGDRENLEAAQAQALLDTIDEIDPRSALKELRLHVQRMLARRKG